MNAWVKLDVGGTKFKTTRGTLTSAPESLLAKMFDPDSERPPAALSEDGYYLIDACPRAFAIILNWLRYKEVLDKEVNPETVIPVADYFGLTELSAKLEAVKKPVIENNNDVNIIRLDVGGQVFKTNRGTMTQKPGTKLAEMFTPGSGTSPPVTEDGSYFIDACPRAFHVVLNWLREREVNDDFRDMETYYDGEIHIPRDVHIDSLYLAAKKVGLKLTLVNLVEDEDDPFHIFDFL